MFLDPGKLLIIGAVALVVLGPDQLPKMAKSAGSLWHDFRRWRATLDEQLRGAFPDLPPTHEIVAAVRSPIALLDRLARESVAPADVGSAGSESAGAPTADAPPQRPPVTADPWDAWPGGGESTAPELSAGDGADDTAASSDGAPVLTDAVWMN